jgi:hypothetical protein
MVMVCLVAAMTLLIPNRQIVSAEPAAQPPVGRYQVFKSHGLADHDCLLDTATGKVWRLKAEGLQQEGKWILAVEAPR